MSMKSFDTSYNNKYQQRSVMHLINGPLPPVRRSLAPVHIAYSPTPVHTIPPPIIKLAN